MPRKIEFKIGDTYGDLTITDIGEKSKYAGMNTRTCVCSCSCGGTRETHLHALYKGKVKVCESRHHKIGSNHPLYAHGKTYTKVHKAWAHIKERCFNQNAEAFQKYGAKGITMCPELKDSFEKFYEEVGDAPSPKHSIDRIDHTKGYFKGNMRWATSKQQSTNRGKQKNNSSGKTGVVIRWTGNPEHTTYVCAIWKELDGAQGSKSFNVSKLGLMVAFRDAAIYRDNKISQLNLQGAEYTYNHGYN